MTKWNCGLTSHVPSRTLILEPSSRAFRCLSTNHNHPRMGSGPPPLSLPHRHNGEGLNTPSQHAVTANAHSCGCGGWFELSQFFLGTTPSQHAVTANAHPCRCGGWFELSQFFLGTTLSQHALTANAHPCGCGG